MNSNSLGLEDLTHRDTGWDLNVESFTTHDHEVLDFSWNFNLDLLAVPEVEGEVSLDLVLSELNSVINVVRYFPSWVVEYLLWWLHSLYRCGLLDWSSRSFLLLSNLCWLFLLGGSDGDGTGEETLVLTFSISI